MKNHLILLFSLVTVFGYAQTLVDPTLSPTTARINAALSDAVAASGTDTYTGTKSGLTNVSGKAYSVTFPNENTGSATFNLNGSGAVTIRKFEGGTLVNLVAGDISAGETKRLRYNGTYLVIEGGSGSGGGVSDWGDIGGTISDQTDLQSALDGKLSQTDITTSRTVTSASATVQSDNLRIVYFDSATPFNFTIDQLTVGTQITLINIGTATVTLLNGTGVTFDGGASVEEGGSAIVLYKTATTPLVIVSGLVDLTSGVTGTLPVSSGGTGATSLPSNRILLGSGTSPITTSSTLSYNGSSFLVGNTTNQLVLGTTNTVTISATAPSSSRTWTIPEQGGNMTFMSLEGTQTLSGAKTFQNAVQIQNTLTISNGVPLLLSGTSAGTQSYGIRDTKSFTNTTASSTVYGWRMNETLTAGAASQLWIGNAFNPIFVDGGFTPSKVSVIAEGTNSDIDLIVARKALIGIGIAGGGITASTQVDQRGLGTTSSTINHRWANSSNAVLAQLTDDGALALNSKIVGRAVLVAGTVTVSTTAVQSGDEIFLTNRITGGTPGLLSVGTVTNGTSFVINSASGSDTSTISWMIIKTAP